MFSYLLRLIFETVFLLFSGEEGSCGGGEIASSVFQLPVLIWRDWVKLASVWIETQYVNLHYYS